VSDAKNRGSQTPKSEALELAVLVDKALVPRSVARARLANVFSKDRSMTFERIGSGGPISAPVSPVYSRTAMQEYFDPYYRKPLSVDGWIPIFSELEDVYAENYKKIASDHLEAVAKHGHNPFMDQSVVEQSEALTKRLIKKHTRRGDRILDVGVGPGKLRRGMGEFKWYGLEGINVACGRIEDLPYKNDIFDTIVCTDVLEHVLDLNYCTSQILRVLKPGGALIIRVPLNEFIEAYLDYDAYDFVHLRRFDLAGLRLHFEKIFDCRFIESVECAPSFTGAHTLKVAALSASSPARDIILSEEHGSKLDFLKPFCSYTSEQVANAFGNLGLNEPELYKQLEDHLVSNTEINVVFVKRH
jgi:SAM-dependent methyltransferase